MPFPWISMISRGAVLSVGVRFRHVYRTALGRWAIRPATVLPLVHPPLTDRGLYPASGSVSAIDAFGGGACRRVVARLGCLATLEVEKAAGVILVLLAALSY